MRTKKVKFGWMSDIDVCTDSELGDVSVTVHMIDGKGNRRSGQIMFNANHLVEALDGMDQCIFHIECGLPKP